MRTRVPQIWSSKTHRTLPLEEHMEQRRYRALPLAPARAVTLVLALVIALLPVARALADESNLVVERPAGEMTYRGYQLFTANVSEDGVATDIAWTTDEMRDAVLSYLLGAGYDTWLAETHPDEGQGAIAQNAAEYLSLRIGASGQAEDGSPQQPTEEGATFSTGLARALAGTTSLPFQTLAANEPFSATQGYWLIVTDPASLDSEGEMGTSPIWLPIGTSLQAVQEKAATPTISKDVFETSTGSWGKVADAFRKEPLDFRITGTLPRNLCD